MATPRAFTLLELLGVVVILFILGALLFPTVSVGPSAAPTAQAKNDVVQLANAVTAFIQEYGRLPATNSGDVGGQLLETLSGEDETTNPGKIVFIEIPDVKKKGGSGIINGTFVDPWGAPYQIVFDADNNWSVTAGTNNAVIPKRVAVWNDPRLEEVEAGWFFLKKSKSRYVTSWE